MSAAGHINWRDPCSDKMACAADAPLPAALCRAMIDAEKLGDRQRKADSNLEQVARIDDGARPSQRPYWGEMRWSPSSRFIRREPLAENIG